MNFQLLIDQAELIYTSKTKNESSSRWIEEDRNFRKWTLKEFQCKVRYYTIHPLEDIDRIFCSVLKSLNERCSAIELATVLGFNVYDDLEAEEKHYRDYAEIIIFEEHLRKVLEWGLIETLDYKTGKDFIKNNPQFKLTELGKKSLVDNCKYKFYSAQKVLFENNLSTLSIDETKYFPFYKALGIFSTIRNSSRIPYNEIDVLADIFEPKDVETIQRQKLQSDREYHIYESVLENFSFTSVDVDIRLFRKDNEYYPVVFFNGQISTEPTELLNNPQNQRIKNIKIEWGLYLKLLHDPNATLDYETLSPFLDILTIDSLIGDTRLEWTDDKLFNYFAELASANQWSKISKICPIDILKRHLDYYIDNLEWNTLTQRFDTEYILQNPIKYPWNFEGILSNDNLSAEDVKSLLLNPYLRDISETQNVEDIDDSIISDQNANQTRYIEWDWDVIMPLLDSDFILEHLCDINFELSDFTQKLEPGQYNYVFEYHSKRWDWQYISNNFSLYFILENISVISSYLNLKTLCDRAFESEEHVEAFCLSIDFNRVISNTENFSLDGFSANSKNYQWSNLLISTLENAGLITWESSEYVSGFECNSYLNWDQEFFNTYFKKIKTENGFRHVSKRISDWTILKQYPDFSWDWDTLSVRKDFNSSISFLESFKEKINLEIILKEASWDVIEAIFEKLDIVSFLNENAFLWQRMTEIATREFIINHIEYSWDWDEITRRFCKTINVKTLGDPKWKEKWDWEYLSQNLDISHIHENLDAYLSYWEWNTLTSRLSSEFVVQNIEKYQSYWNWEYLSENLDIKIVQNNLKNNIQYWNWNIITKRISSEFVVQNLKTYSDYWVWDDIINDKLQKEQLLQQEILQVLAHLLFSKKEELRTSYWSIITKKFTIRELERLIVDSYNLSEYLWDYQYLYNHPKFDGKKYLDESSAYISWKEFSSSNSANSLFEFNRDIYGKKAWVRKVVSKQLNNPLHNWDFAGLSRLPNIDVNHEIYTITPEKWDWDYISEFGTCFKKGKAFEDNFNLHREYIKFELLSKRTDVGITEALIADNIEYPWDWNSLVNNEAVEFSFKFIFLHQDKPWKWEQLSGRQDLKWEIIIKNLEMDWNWPVLAKNTNLKLTGQVLIDFSDKPWDWVEISRRKDIKFDKEIITKLIDQPFDWSLLSQNKSLIQNDFVLTAIKSKWSLLDWSALSQNIQDHQLSIQFLSSYKVYLDWSIVNKKLASNITEEHLAIFWDVLDWSNASKSHLINFTSELIDKYRRHWDWFELSKNSKIIEINLLTDKYKTELNCIDFIDNFPKTPYIYHFTHLFNAIDVIKGRRILSRNKAKELGLLKYDAAGKVVDRTSKAHPFARFYFRPQTPTQFYNECLGKDSYDHKYFERARNLGLPKCPMPVFFKFDLKEILMNLHDKCYYSTGNMQTNWASVAKVSEDPHRLNTEKLYYNMSDAYPYAKSNSNGDEFKWLMSQYISDCLQYSQQEFLVMEELDFSTINSLEIICYDEEQANILKTLLGDDPICDKINANGSEVYHRGNRELHILQTESEITIDSEYEDSAYLSIQGEGINGLEITDPSYIKKETVNEIIASKSISFIKTEKPIEVHFVDTSIGKRDWLIYKN